MPEHITARELVDFGHYLLVARRNDPADGVVAYTIPDVFDVLENVLDCPQAYNDAWDAFQQEKVRAV